MLPLANRASFLANRGRFMFPVQPKLGHWYIAVLCTNCDTLTALFSDDSQGQSKLNGSYLIRCPRCKEVGHYDAQHYQHRERRKSGLRLQIL